MATGQHQQTEISRYGPISTKSQATQTLLVQTQIPTQLMSHEVHQFTQLINHDSVEHVGADTMVNDSDPEGSGNTVVLHDDDGDDVHGEAESGPSPRGKAGPSSQDQRDDNPHVTPPHKVQSGWCENGPHVEHHDLAPSKLIDDFIAPRIHRDLPHSDATTEEGDVENIGYLDADAESQPPHIDDNKGVHLGEKTSEVLQPVAVNAQDNLADMTGKKLSQSRRPSIASVRAESLHASGLRAACRSGSVGKDDGNLDSDATVELTRGMLNGELKMPLEAPETELENQCANKAADFADFDSMQSSPKATLPFDGMMAHSPRMSTSRSKSKGRLLGCASQQHALEQEPIKSDATIELNTNMVEGLSRFGSAINVKVQSKQPSSQKARKLVFDFMDTSPTTSMDRLEDGGGNADPKALGTEHDYVLKKPITVIDAPARERQCSLPAGFRAASTNLSYLESQDPGEDSQANALNIVDKLVWLDTTDDVATSPVPQDGSVKGHTGAKGRQSLAQAAQMKTVHDKLDVFDWEDSQADEGVSPERKQGPASTKAQKRHSEAYEPITDRKKRATPHQQKIEITLRMDKTGDDSGKEKRTTPDVGITEVPNVEPSSSNQEVKPHILLTTRLQNIKTESRPSAKGRKFPGLKSKPRKDVGKEKQIDESVRDFEPGQQQGVDGIEGKVQQAGLRIKNKLSRRTGKKKLVHESGKELESEQQKGIDRKGRNLRHSDSLSAKGKREPLKTSEVGPQIQGHLALADRTSQDDAAADIWIEAFTNAKNETPAGSSVEVIKFRKRSALHEDTRQDSKKCRTTEPATVSCNEEHQNMTKKDKNPMKENRVKPGLSTQQAPKDVNAAAIPLNKGRTVSTRFSQGENQNIEKEEDKMEDQLILKTKQKSKKPRIADDLTLSKVKGRRVSTRNSQGGYQDASKPEEKPMEEDKAEQGLKTRLDPKQCKTTDVAITLPVKSRGVGTRGSGAEHMEAENAREDDMLERGPKTRSRAQEVKSIVAVSDAKEGIRARNAAIKSSTTKATADGMDEPSLSRGAMQADFDAEKPSIKTGNSKKKESSWSHRHLTSTFTPDVQEIEANSCKVGSSGLLSPPLTIDGSVGALAGGPKKSKMRRASSDVIAPESTIAGESSGSWLKGRDKDKSLPKIKDIGCKKGDVSSTILLRRTRSSLCDDGSQKDDSIDAGKDTVQIQGGPTTDKQCLQKCIDFSDAKKGVKKQVAKSATRTTKSISQRHEKTHTLEMLNSPNLVDEGRRRKRESGCIRVLFSHSLTEETIKHQKKILAKLGGQLAISASDCTHFVSNGFARSQNMLISMAAGKEVVTTLWLESCGQARYFVDEKAYIPQDVKKEKEFGFSMMASLASARRKPLLKGVNVLVCPNTVPEPAVLKAIVQSAGGQVVDVKLWSSHLNEKESDTLFILIANEKDFDFCVQFLDKGLKVYSEELLLHGIVTQTLDYSRNRLFENFKQQKGRRRAANINA